MNDRSDLLSAGMIQRRVKALAALLGVPDFTIRTESMEDGSPHLEISDAYYLVFRERGSEHERRKTTDLDELLYWILELLTSRMSWAYELRHRREKEDARRQAFAKQIELLALLSPAWAERQKAEQVEILKKHPFHDS